MTTELSGKYAVVTGGGTNIGLAVAQTLISQGATVALIGRDATRLHAATETLGSGALAVPADVSVEGQINEAIDHIVSTFGRIDIAVNNAGIVGAVGPLAQTEPAAYEQIFRTNVMGTYLSMRAEIEALRQGNGGTIINCASNIGYHGRRPGMSAYAASKAAVSVMTRTAALEYIGEGIRINAVSPGATDTPMSFRSGEDRAARDARVSGAVPIGRVASTDEIAQAVLWLASSRSSYVVGHDLVIDGGTTA